MGTSLIAFLDTHRSISRYVASLLVQKSHSSRHKKYLTKIPTYWKMVSYPLINEGQLSYKYVLLRASGAMLLRLGASLKRVNGAIILENGLVPPCSILLLYEYTSKRLEEFEGYWQMRLVTVHPYGLNKINELRECHQRFGTKF